MKSKNNNRKGDFKVKAFIKLFSNQKGEIYRFLQHYYRSSDNFFLEDISLLEFEKSYQNPIEMAEIIGVFIDNIDDFKITMWVCLDEDVLINVNPNNVNDLICYLYERFPY